MASIHEFSDYSTASRAGIQLLFSQREICFLARKWPSLSNAVHASINLLYQAMPFENEVHIDKASARARGVEINENSALDLLRYVTIATGLFGDSNIQQLVNLGVSYRLLRHPYAFVSSVVYGGDSPSATQFAFWNSRLNKPLDSGLSISQLLRLPQNAYKGIDLLDVPRIATISQSIATPNLPPQMLNAASILLCGELFSLYGSETPFDPDTCPAEFTVDVFTKHFFAQTTS